MDTLTLKIIFHGLIALVPTTGLDGSAHMTALLVDARQSPSGASSECFSPYRPMLRVNSSSDECLAAGCSPSGQTCTCNLSRQEISTHLNIWFTKRNLAKKPPSGLPVNPQQAGDFSYIANMARPPFNTVLNSNFLKAIPPSILVARMEFPFETITACALSNWRDEGADMVHSMSMHPVHTPPVEEGDDQALAQAAVAELTIPKNEKVMLTIRNFDTTKTQFLTLKPEANGYRIELLNERVTLDLDDPCADGVGRDFAFFYELVQSPPSWRDRLIPHINYMQRKSAKGIKPSECAPYSPLVSRPICPMASFNP
jgi:hypothetical protein